MECDKHFAMYDQSFLLVSLSQYAFMEFIDCIVILYHASVEPAAGCSGERKGIYYKSVTDLL